MEEKNMENSSCYAKHILKYKGQISYTFSNAKKNVDSDEQELLFFYAFESMTKQIREEHVIYDIFGMIGSLGGSLSLFIGFSFFDYGCKLVNKVFSCTYYRK